MARQILSINATLLPVGPGGSPANFRSLAHSDGTPLRLPSPSPSPMLERFEVVKTTTVTVELGPAAPYPQEQAHTPSGVSAICLAQDGQLVFGKASPSGAVYGLTVIWLTAPDA